MYFIGLEIKTFIEMNRVAVRSLREAFLADLYTG